MISLRREKMLSSRDLNGSNSVLISRILVSVIPIIIFCGVALSLLAVKVSPVDMLGYFSIEAVTPLIYWVLLVALVAFSVLSIESNNRTALIAIVLTMLTMRIPFILMFKLPPEPDSYIYMGIIQKWHQTGTIDLTVDLRARYWPVFFLFMYCLRVLGINELTIWSLGPMIIGVVNALLIFSILRTFVSQRAAMYALLFVSLAPTFNFYYYQVLAPQLLAATIFLVAVLVLLRYEPRRAKVTFAAFIGLFMLLLLTHHLTTLLLIAYVFFMILEAPLVGVLNRLGITSTEIKDSIRRRNLGILGVGMLVVWVSYLFLVAQQFTRLTLGTLAATVAGQESTYGFSSYSISTYAFNMNSFSVYGFRLTPLLISGFLLLLMWGEGFRKAFRITHSLAKKLRSLTATFGYGALMLFSIVVLKGLFLEIPRLFDLTVLFSSATSGYCFLQKQWKSTGLLKGIFILSILALSSTIGMAVHTAEFVYYPQERQAVSYAASNYPGVTLYTDERLLPFAAYFAPSLDVRVFPSTLASMLPNGTLERSLVLLSSHSLTYEQYRDVFGQPSSNILQFLETHGHIVYSSDGVILYLL
jgi:hypothetical protein